MEIYLIFHRHLHLEQHRLHRLITLMMRYDMEFFLIADLLTYPHSLNEANPIFHTK